MCTVDWSAVGFTRRALVATGLGSALMASLLVVASPHVVAAGTVRPYNVLLNGAVEADTLLSNLGIDQSRTTHVFESDRGEGIDGFSARLTSKEVALLEQHPSVASVQIDQTVTVDAMTNLSAETPSDSSQQMTAGEVIPGRYIITLKEDANSEETQQVLSVLGTSIVRTFADAIDGYVAQLSESDVKIINGLPGVAYVEPDRVVAIAAEQVNPPWGLDRIDQRDRPTNSRYSYDADGSGINVYVIDTGLDATNSEFTGRVVSGYSSFSPNTDTTDCNGHGTHVSGTIAGTTYGVAKDATIIPIKVLDCNGSGSISGVIAGIEWAKGHHEPGVKAIANLSLGGGYSLSFNTAIANLVNDGVVTVVAAGNETVDACTKSPASAPSAITVGATDSSDVQAWFSNYGTCLDVYAPGVSILSSTLNGGTGRWSGTSMASPHVAGAAAVLWELNPSYTRINISDLIINSASTGKISSLSAGSPNRLLFIPSNGVPPSAPNKPTALLQSGVVTVSWDPPSTHGNSALTGYTASSSVGNFTCSTNAATSSCSFSTLPPGTYSFSVIAHNSSGASPSSVPSDPVTISGSNDMFADAGEISGTSGQITNSNLYASTETNEPQQAIGTGGASIWYRYRPWESGTFTADLSGSTFDTVLEIFAGASLSNLVRVGFDDDSGSGLTSKLTVNATKDVSYFVRISSYGTARGNIQLVWSLQTGECVVGAPPNDSFCRAEVLSNLSGQTVVEAYAATSEYGEPERIAGTKPIWYRFTPNSRATVSLKTAGSNFDTVLGLFTGTEITDLSLVAYNDDAVLDRTSAITISVSAGVTYYVAVGGYGGATGQVVFDWDIAPIVAPSAPTDVRAIPRPTSAFVSWNTPATGASPDVVYVVVASPGGSTCEAEVITQCEVSDLSAGRTYTFTVQARNEAGSGPASVPSAPVTLASNDLSQRFAKSWGIDRLDQRNNALDGFVKTANTGAGTRVYVVDTGIRTTHSEFRNRVAPGISTVPGSSSVQDCHGHGTHVASTAVGTTLGVAPSATVIPVRVLDCDGRGTTSQIVAGLDWIRNNMQPGVPTIVNMSLGGQSKDDLLIAAVESLVNAGAVVVAAAGNNGANACSGSPSGIPAVITVAASTVSDTMVAWSNFGSCVDIIAPGVEILGAGPLADSAIATMSGTSMAAPHVSGVTAVLRSAYKDVTPSQVMTMINALSSKDAVGGILNATPNRLLFVPTTTCEINTSFGKSCAATEPSSIPVVRVPTVTITRSTPLKSVIRRAGISVRKNSQVRVRVLKNSRRICRVAQQRVDVLRNGRCELSVQVSTPNQRSVVTPLVVSVLRKSSVQR